ncbi:putative iron-only hydrogenase system regulator [Dethiosulfatibacter aminovorans DSM 17477]|uniref:Putative iron-only hydrogenase system regulator n=1 Tax=Dethiosulfatibacter aminovorans DSM 17477 TaxID=1121476 RepID=A0A1M6FY27_9FIRM|nr:TM1266 family iron-only hydrogenase system putative regulator [Dethiosulfatibacter aminovorans]SHJ02615.1 putative iron-only hydrogenase system regulator [Dethiosulfatibacter aminovorans DSM 17477]
MNRIGVVGIVIEDIESVSMVNEILHSHADIIVGRMGIPYKNKNINVISIIVDGTTDDIGSLTGKLGSVSGITVKSALTKKIFHDN